MNIPKPILLASTALLTVTGIIEILGRATGWAIFSLCVLGFALFTAQVAE